MDLSELNKNFLTTGVRGYQQFRLDRTCNGGGVSVEVCLEGIGRLNQLLHQATIHTKSEGKLPKLFLFGD